MAESEPTGGVDLFENVTFVPASTSADENASLENTSSLGNLRLGFSSADILVTEGVATQGISRLGTCVLLQNPATWGEKDTSARRFAITAAHCVAKPDSLGNIKIISNIRLRLPLRPWKDFPEDTEKYQHGQKETNHLYKSIVISKKQIFLHEKYDGKWQSGYDVALIAIPETAVRSESLAFNAYEWGDSYPDSASINGYPMMTNRTGMVFSHLPYISTRIRSDDDDDWIFTERKRRGMVEYPLKTAPGISGGALVVNGFVVGIHNAKNENQDGHGWGTAFTMDLKDWIESKYSDWASVMTDAATKSNSSIASPSEDKLFISQEKSVSSWAASDVATWLTSIHLGQYANIFVSEGISGEYLVTLDEEMLEEFGITKKFHQHKFKREREKLLNKEKEIQSAPMISPAQNLEAVKKEALIHKKIQEKVPNPPPQEPPASVPDLQDCAGNGRPSIGDQFKVEGAKRWNKYNDINGIVNYRGEIDKVLGTPQDRIEFGTLVFVRDKNWYVIKTDADGIHFCENDLGNQWYSSSWGYSNSSWNSNSKEEGMRVSPINKS